MKIKDQVNEIFEEYPGGGIALVATALIFGVLVGGILI